MKLIRNRPTWVGEATSYFHDSRRKKTFYREFIFGSVQAKKGDFVLVSNADAVDPDTPEGCDVAEIIELYETADDEDPYRAIVRWYSRPRDVPKRTIKFVQLDSKVEVILDERPFDNDVSIETFFSNCVVVRAKVDDDPVLEAKKLGEQVCVPVFVCRYKLVLSGRLAKLEPYFVSDKTEVNKSDFKHMFEVPIIASSSASGVTKENKSYEQKSLKVDGSTQIHLKTGVYGFPSNLDANASEAMLGSTSKVVLKRLNFEMNRQADSVEDGDRSSSPTIPFTEPSMRWYRIKDDSNDYTVVKVPIEVCHSSRKSAKNVESGNTQTHVKNVNLKDAGDVTSDSEDEISNIADVSWGIPLMHNKKGQMNNAKAGTHEKHRISKQEVILDTKSFTHKTKLKDTDISQLLDVDDCGGDDYSNNASFMLDKVTDRCLKSPSCQNSQLKRSRERAHVDSKSAVLLGMKVYEVNTSDVPDKCTQRNNIQNCENKVKTKYIKPAFERSMSEENSDLTSTLTYAVKIAELKKQGKEQWSGSIDGCTEFNMEHGKSTRDSLGVSSFKSSDSFQSTHNVSVLNTRHSDDKVAKLLKSQPCTSKSRHHRASAKKKLSYEYGETKQKVSFGECRSRCRVTGRSLACEGERIKGLETDRNGRAELHTTKQGCTNKHINFLEYVQKSDVTDCTLVSVKNSETADRHQDVLRHIQDTTPRRHKRQIAGDSADEDSYYEQGSKSGSKRYKSHDNTDEDSDYERGSKSRSKRYKSHDNTDEDSDYEPGIVSRSRRYESRELQTTKSSKTDQKASPCLRSSSRRHKPNKWYGSDWSTATTTPSRLLKRQVKVGMSGTPRTPKSEVTPQASITPISKRGFAWHSVQTPSLPTRASSVPTPGSILEEARVRLHVAAVPKSLPCREKEFDNIYRFVEGKVHDGAGGCMYISGVPGTGKTATVQEVVRSLQDAVSERNIPDFQFIELNGMWLTEPRQAYVHLLKALTGQAVTAEQAQQLLERRFSHTAPRRITTLVLVDELDLLWTKRQDVVYNLLDWPTKSASRLIVLAIANTMDLPERLLMGRVTSRLGLTRVTFHPYTHKQLQEIVMARLRGLRAFDPDAIQLVARKVAAVSGDARRALDICRRATELAEEGTENGVGAVTMQHVDQALGEMIASTKVQAVRCCSKMEQLFLQAVTAEIQRTGVEETVFEQVYVQLRTLCTFDGYTVPSVTEALGLCARLGSCRLLLTEHSRTDVHQRVLLNVSSDDIYYALKVQ